MKRLLMGSGLRSSWLSLCLLGMIAPSTARAEMIFLDCGPTTGTTIWEIDTTRNTLGGRPATITPTAIQQTNENEFGKVEIYIDRVKGTLFQATTYYMPDGTRKHVATPPVSCSRVSAPNTKF